MSIGFGSHYWFVNLPDPPAGMGEARPLDWAERKAKEFVSEAPALREIVKSCGWAVCVSESWKHHHPGVPKVEGCLVAMEGSDDCSALSLYLGVTCYGEGLVQYFDEPEDDATPDVPHSAIYDDAADATENDL